MNQLLFVILIINLGFVMVILGPLGFFLTLGLATIAYYSLSSMDYIKKTWPLKAAYIVIMVFGVITVQRAFNMVPLTFAIGLLETIAFFIFSNIQRF